MLLRNWITMSLALALVSVPLGCEKKSKAPEGDKPHRILKRASFDMNCPAEQLDTFLLDEHTRAVVGCGKRATYNHICDEHVNVGMTVAVGLPVSDTECHYELDQLSEDQPAPASSGTQPAAVSPPAAAVPAEGGGPPQPPGQ